MLYCQGDNNSGTTVKMAKTLKPMHCVIISLAILYTFSLHSLQRPKKWDVPKDVCGKIYEIHHQFVPLLKLVSISALILFLWDSGWGFRKKFKIEYWTKLESPQFRFEIAVV